MNDGYWRIGQEVVSRNRLQLSLTGRNKPPPLPLPTNFFFSFWSGDGGAVAYALVSGSDRKFEVDVSTGLVTTVDYLDYETKTSYLMNISATDQAPPFHQGFCTVYVTLLNELDEAVAFSSASYEASLRENIATGMEVVQVQAQSADNLNQLTYRFDPDTSPAALALFKIDSVTVRKK